MFNQQNLDFDSLKNILNNLYEDVQIYNYNNYLLLVSDDILDIDCSTPTIIESETYSKTYIIYLEKITNIDNLDFKINITNELIDIIINDSNTSKFITLNDLIMYKVTSIASNNKQISSLIKYLLLLLLGISFDKNTALPKFTFTKVTLLFSTITSGMTDAMRAESWWMRSTIPFSREILWCWTTWEKWWKPA